MGSAGKHSEWARWRAPSMVLYGVFVFGAKFFMANIAEVAFSLGFCDSVVKLPHDMCDGTLPFSMWSSYHRCESEV